MVTLFIVQILVDACERSRQTTSVNIAVMRGAGNLEALLQSETCGDLNQWGEYDNRSFFMRCPASLLIDA